MMLYPALFFALSAAAYGDGHNASLGVTSSRRRCSWSDPNLNKQGYIMDTSNNNFLTCTTSACTWQATPSQMFKMVKGHDCEYQFRIFNVPENNSTGEPSEPQDTYQCLDRIHCHHGSSNIRMGSCGHCGSYHWGYDAVSKKMAEDHMKNCVQSSGDVEHCDQSHAAVHWPYMSDCSIDHQTVTNVQCKNKNTGGTCGADFIKGSTKGAHSTNDCKNCQAAKGSSLKCSFNFAVSTQKSTTVTFSSATKIGVQMGLKFEAGIIFAKAETSFQVSVDETLTYGHATTHASTVQIGNQCEVDLQAGTWEAMSAEFFTGTVKGDFTADVTTYWKCGWKQPVKESTTGTITIDDVPVSSSAGSCTAVAKTCPKMAPFIV